MVLIRLIAESSRAVEWRSLVSTADAVFLSSCIQENASLRVDGDNLDIGLESIKHWATWHHLAITANDSTRPPSLHTKISCRKYKNAWNTAGRFGNNKVIKRDDRATHNSQIGYWKHKNFDWGCVRQMSLPIHNFFSFVWTRTYMWTHPHFVTLFWNRS
jgi:hypothetical protein